MGLKGLMRLIRMKGLRGLMKLMRLRGLKGLIGIELDFSILPIV